MGRWRVYGNPDLSPLQPLWEHAAGAGAPCVFRSFALARSWARAFAPEIEVRILVAEGVPVILPFVLRNGQLGLIGEGLFDYQDLCGDPGAFTPELQVESRWLASGWKWNRVQITGVPAASPSGDYWNSWAGRQDFASAPRRPAQAPPLPRQHPRYARRWRRAVAMGIRLHCETAPAKRRAVLHWLLERKAEHFGTSNVLQPLACRWLETMVENEPDMAELWSLRSGDEILSALLCWRGVAARSAYTISYDQRAAELSPGVLLLYAVVCRCGEERMDFDFLTGEQSFKQHFATEATRLLRFHGSARQPPACRPS